LVPQTKRAGKEWFVSGNLACDVSHKGFADADNLVEIYISLTAVINMSGDFRIYNSKTIERAYLLANPKHLNETLMRNEVSGINK
jgi:hypothetical protein